jgi:cytoskeletal protein CcmA (bactofilin family)
LVFSLPRRRKDGVVDSYAAIKAAQHAARAHPQRAPVATDGGQPHELQQLGAQITRTAIPAKQLIECYECGYKFQLHGRAASTNCSKCRVMLDLTDHVINKKWNGTIKTAGKVHIASSGIAESGEIVASEIVLEGKIETGRVRATQKLEIWPGSRFCEDNVRTVDLFIAPGATATFNQPTDYRSVEVAGTLHANLHANGTVIVKAGGRFVGEIYSGHLIVEDGGGLQALVKIQK